jgi:hypothetical protein
MQLLNTYIEKNFKNNKAAFARHMNVSSQQITRWINEEWIVNDDKLYSPRRDIPKFVMARNAFHSEKKFPLYHEDSTNPAFKKSLILDIETGEIFVDFYWGSPDIFSQRKLSFNVSTTLTASEIERCINDHIDTFQAILTGASVVYDGQNLVGKFSNDAKKWITLLRDTLSDIETSEDVYILDDVDTYLEEDPFGCKYGAKNLVDVESHILKEVESEPDIEMSDDLKNDLERAILNYYNYLLSNDELLHGMSVPTWVKQIEEFECLIDEE